MLKGVDGCTFSGQYHRDIEIHRRDQWKMTYTKDEGLAIFAAIREQDR